jgi:hypothetical protein
VSALRDDLLACERAGMVWPKAVPTDRWWWVGPLVAAVLGAAGRR